MNVRRFAIEAVTLIAAAVLCALVSNALAARERKLVLQGFYPNAQKVPVATAEPAPLTVPTSTVAPATTGTTATNGTNATLPVTTTTAAPATTTSQPRNPATPQPTPAPPTQQPSNPATQPPAPTPQPRNPATPSAPDLTKFTPHPNAPYVEIAYADVNALHDAGVLFLDARRTSIYEQGHIAGARPFSVWESDVDEKVTKLFDERGDPREQAKPIVVYCSGGECEDSHMLAQKLWGVQFNNVYVYKDGYPDWVAHHGPTHTGPTP